MAKSVQSAGVGVVEKEKFNLHGLTRVGSHMVGRVDSFLGGREGEREGGGREGGGMEREERKGGREGGKERKGGREGEGGESV